MGPAPRVSGSSAPRVPCLGLVVQTLGVEPLPRYLLRQFLGLSLLVRELSLQHMFFFFSTLFWVMSLPRWSW